MNGSNDRISSISLTNERNFDVLSMRLTHYPRQNARRITILISSLSWSGFAITGRPSLSAAPAKQRSSKTSKTSKGKKRGRGNKKKKKEAEKIEKRVFSRPFSRDAITATGRTNFLRFDLKCHSRRRGREANEEGGRDRYRILGIEADEKENRAGSADSHWIPGAPDLIGDDRLNKLSGYLPPLSAPYSDRARGSTIGILFPRRGEKRFWIGINRLT